MTPKEKAEELVFKIHERMFDVRDGYNSTEVSKAVKQCALIAVDEIFKLQSIDSYDWHFYKEVKQEIEAL